MVEKFWLLEDLHKLLLGINIGRSVADLITFIVACGAIYLFVRITDWAVLKIVIKVIQKASRRTNTMWDDYLVKRKFFSRLFNLIPIVVISILLKALMSGFEPNFVNIIQRLVNSGIVFIVLLTINSLINAAYDVYKTKPMAKQKSMKGYKQVANIIVFFIGSIIVISILFDKSPWAMLASLGAAAALMTLVFKDTIMGFVASIQLSAQDMVRPGDWIAMPTKNADGIVKDINVNSVKVQNWDNTITMIPVYSMVTEAFTNWRGMTESDGRRFNRQIHIDSETIRFFDDKLDNTLKTNAVLSPLRDKIIRLTMPENGELTTNMSLFRTYMELYLREHPKVNENLPLYVRYLDSSFEKGVGIELYGFCIEKDGDKFYPVISSIIEHTLAVAPLFGLRIYQNITGNTGNCPNN